MYFDNHQHDDQVVVPDLFNQLAPSNEQSKQYFSAPDIDLDQYDSIIIAMSAGKDSIASLLRLFDMGVDRSKIELWHHDIDSDSSQLMDWAFMLDYNRKLARVFDLPLYFSALEGGIEGEMLKHNSYSKPHIIETPDGVITLQRDRKRSKPGTRLKFPQVSQSLQTRWCSSIKVDLGRRALNNQVRFEHQKTLFVTGERRQESAARAKYNQLEIHACDRRAGRLQRHVDAWRPVLLWSEEEVWEILQRYQVIPPVPYRLGWSRSSCACCIFNGPRIWATIAHYFPERAQRIAEYEAQFGVTISRSKKTVLEIANRVEPLVIDDLEALDQASKESYQLPVLLTWDRDWKLPAGAFQNVDCGSV